MKLVILIVKEVGDSILKTLNRCDVSVNSLGTYFLYSRNKYILLPPQASLKQVLQFFTTLQPYTCAYKTEVFGTPLQNKNVFPRMYKTLKRL